jgi:hypothetical protein
LIGQAIFLSLLLEIRCNSYNRLLEESATQLGGVASNLAKQASTVRVTVQDATTLGHSGAIAPEAGATINDSAARIETLARTVEEELAKLKHQTTLSPFLPSSWALAFFAALAITFGHMTYQAGVPEIVRQHSLDEFIRSAIRDYRETPTDRALENALNQITNTQKESFSIPSLTEDVDQRLRKELDIIGAAARVTYKEASRLNIHLIIPALILYSFGLSIIVYIIVQQSLAVSEAAGWITESDIIASGLSFFS